MKLEAVSAYRPICAADALYGLDLGLMTKRSFFNRPKIISCQKWTIKVRVGVIATSARSKLVIRRSKIIFKHFLIGGLK